MPRFATYTRVSTAEQAERATIETQREFLRRYCELHGIQPVVEYEDAGVSGTVPVEQRPAGARMLREAGTLWDALLLYRLDRIGRDARIILNVVHALDERGVVCRSVTEPFDTSSPAGRFMLTILSGVAGMERDVIVERTTDGCFRRARENAWLGGPCPPFGYRVEGEGRERRIQPNEEPIPGTAPVVSPADVIRELYRAITAERLSCLTLARRLNAEGIPPPYSGRIYSHAGSGKPPNTQWSERGVRDLLVNPVYRGERIYGRKGKHKRGLVSQTVPALVDRATWDAAQLQLRANQRNSPKNNTRTYLLRGLIRCRLCNKVLLGFAQQHYRYYRCGGKCKLVDRSRACRCPNLSAGPIEVQAWQGTVERLGRVPEVLAQLRAKRLASAGDGAQVERERDTLEDALKRKAAERELMWEQFRISGGRMSQETLYRQLDAIAAEEDRLRERLVALQDRGARAEEVEAELADLETLLHSWADLLARGEITTADQMEALCACIEVVWAGEEAPEIVWRF